MSTDTLARIGRLSISRLTKPAGMISPSARTRSLVMRKRKILSRFLRARHSLSILLALALSFLSLPRLTNDLCAAMCCVLN